MKIVRSFLLLTIMLVMMFSLTSTSNMVVAEESAAKGEEAEECASTEDGTCQANASDEPAATSNNNSDSATPEDSNCPSRPHIIKCAGAHLDLNHNGKLERAELQSAIDSLPWYARGILNILGSVDKMMKKCDVDGDDAIGMDYDMQHNQESCLATCLKRRVFKGAFFPKCDL